MPGSASTLRFIRRIHLYIGVFIAPALLFFALTGAMQTFSLHETTPGSDYKPPAWIAILAQLHKKQTTTIPVRKARPTDAPIAAPQPAATPGVIKPAATTLAPQPQAPAKRHLPMKIFFLIVALGLFTSTLTGIYMAYKYERNGLLITGLLLAGIAAPLLLLRF